GCTPRAHCGDELAGAQREEDLAVAARLGDRLVLARVADIETAERERPPALRADESDLSAERHQRGREIAAEGRKAYAAAFRGDVAHLARSLEAVVVGGAPPFALVVIDAARIKAEIATDRAHVAMRRPSDDVRGLRHDRVMLDDRRVGGKLGEGHR